jgi:hypothetical protein
MNHNIKLEFRSARMKKAFFNARSSTVIYVIHHAIARQQLIAHLFAKSSLLRLLLGPTCSEEA